MNTETTNVQEHEVNGGAPTDEEARLAAQVDTIGDNPEADPDVAAAAAATTTAAATDGDGAATATSTAGDAPAVGAEGGDAAAAAVTAAGEEPPAAVPAAAPVAPASAVPAKPVAPKNFDAEYAAIQKRYDDGELESTEFQAATRALTKEEAAFQTRVTLWEENQAAAQQSAAATFDAAAAAWERANKDFMDNPLRRDAMQRALAVIDQETGGTLPPGELLERAGKAAFEAFGYKPATAAAAAPAANAADAIAQATEARKVAPVPTTLGTAPAAASMERGGGNAAFSELDGKDINTLEDAVARMSPQQREAYLLDAPGAKATGIPE